MGVARSVFFAPFERRLRPHHKPFLNMGFFLLPFGFLTQSSWIALGIRQGLGFRTRVGRGSLILGQKTSTLPVASASQLDPFENCDLRLS